ncbi:hypothetical protein Ade02nite_49830 [Paractinoplanes deccanensis]|uniref:DUF4245 domain-containing protein n=1 Tax=Paractinoplanes deccanensis TaxID=113561 RepID=A0ABQ3Y8N2_9ACTN|nr:DUF4245 domain-containing protein [Actinoplanes deccanensis]GID76342.1 hypothetical protein Ade02nite_49830 [Actinoplanes deccanensis]
MEPASPAPVSGPPAPQAEPSGTAAAAPAPTGSTSAAGATSVAAAASGSASDGAPVRLARGQERSPKDMAMSLLVLLVPIALLLIFYRTVLNGDAPITVDPAPSLQEARRANVFTVVEPRGLGDDWHVSSATFRRDTEGATLRIGYVDPDKDALQLVESNVPSATLLPTELTKAAKPAGEFRSDAGVWRLYDTRPGEKALVLADQTRTVIVIGKSDVERLETLAGSLS